VKAKLNGGGEKFSPILMQLKYMGGLKPHLIYEL